MIKAVIFDMDGVLIDSEGIYLDRLLEFAHTKNPDVKREDIAGTVGRTARDSWSIMEKAIDRGISWEELRQEYRDGWQNYDEIDYTKIFRREIRSILAYLKENGYKLAVASSTQLPLVTRVLKENGIFDEFDMVVSGNMFQRSKPDPEIYLYTAEKLGVTPGECLVLEDSTVGIRSAHDAGMTVAALIDDRFGFDRTLADIEVEKPEDILLYLKAHR